MWNLTVSSGQVGGRVVVRSRCRCCIFFFFSGRLGGWVCGVGGGGGGGEGWTDSQTSRQVETKRLKQDEQDWSAGVIPLSLYL